MSIPMPKMPVPSAGIFDLPLVGCQINAEWATYIDGQLSILLDERQWDDIDAQRAVQEIAKFIETLGA